MTGLVITPKGMEDICCKELMELGASPAPTDSAVTFEAKDLAAECIVAYRAQSALRVMHFLCRFQAPSLDEGIESLSQELKKCDVSSFFLGKSFKVETLREGEHDFTSPEFSAKAGELLLSQCRTSKVKMEGYECLLLVYINGPVGYCGIDLAGFDLGKRDYRLFRASTAVKAPLAYAAVRLGTEDCKKLLDPFCGAGSIAIEAAIHSTGQAVHAYEKSKFLFSHMIDAKKIFSHKPSKQKFSIVASDAAMVNLSAAKKNAKIAGVEKLIKFSRMDLEWLDIKFGKKELDAIVTCLPTASRLLGEAVVAKIHREFFHQAEYILNGTITALSARPLTPPLPVVHARTVLSGKQELYLTVMKVEK